MKSNSRVGKDGIVGGELIARFNGCESSSLERESSELSLKDKWSIENETNGGVGGHLDDVNDDF